jgi:2-amino-4-hydroxy-6-hydroxymethyldihydropteridine diphosphokinase
MNKAYLLLGSNMGNSAAQLSAAITYIDGETGHIIKRSGLYLTAAWGNNDQPDFVNQVVIVDTTLTASETLHSILLIEEKMGRVRTLKNAPRIIDIDILFFNSEIIWLPNLLVPHPEIPNRRFVLVPLNEIEPGLEHPVLHKTISRLLADCPDPLDVKKF